MSTSARIVQYYLPLCVAMLNLAMVRNTPQGVDELSPAEILEQLLAQEHVWGNEQAMAYYEMIERNPDMFIDPLRVKLGLPTSIDELALTDRLHSIERALGVLNAIGPDRGKPIAREVFDNIDREIALSHDLERKDGTVKNLDRLRGGVLRLMKKFGDGYAVDCCVREIGSSREFANRVIMLEYLEATAPYRPDVRPKLEEMYNAPDSALRNNPQLKRVLDAMDAADKGKKPEGKDAESRPEGERKP